MSGAARPRRLHPIVPLVALVRQLPELLVPAAGAVALSWDDGLGTLLRRIVQSKPFLTK